MQNTLTQRQKLFCRFYAALHNPKEAALRAGFAPSGAEQAAIALLEQPQVREYIQRLGSCMQLRDAVRAGYERLAFGSIADAVSLVLRSEEDPLPSLDGLDLFCVSEIKRVKGGGFEVKFADRLEALDRLAALARQEEDASGSSFYAALERGAAAAAGGGHDSL